MADHPSTRVWRTFSVLFLLIITWLSQFENGSLVFVIVLWDYHNEGLFCLVIPWLGWIQWLPHNCINYECSCSLLPMVGFSINVQSNVALRMCMTMFLKLPLVLRSSMLFSKRNMDLSLNSMFVLLAVWILLESTLITMSNTISFKSLCSYSVFPMAITNDMIIAVASEENIDGKTEFYVHNVVWNDGWIWRVGSQVWVQGSSYRS